MKESLSGESSAIFRRPRPTTTKTENIEHADLLADLRVLIEQARNRVAQAIDTGMVILYWHVGAGVRREVLGQRRAQYGEQIVATVSRQLGLEYGRGFAEKNLRRMVLFSGLFPDGKIVTTLRGSTQPRREILQHRDLSARFLAEILGSGNMPAHACVTLEATV